MAKKKRKRQRIPQSAEAKAARQAIIQADLLGLESDRSRLAELSQGAYSGGPRLRSSGSSISSRYRIGRPKADKGYGIPPPLPPYGGGTPRAPAPAPSPRRPKAKQPLGRGRPGTAKEMIRRSGGGRKTLKRFRSWDRATQQRLLRKARTTRATLTQLVRRRQRRLDTR